MCGFLSSCQKQQLLLFLSRYTKYLFWRSLLGQMKKMSRIFYFFPLTSKLPLQKESMFWQTIKNMYQQLHTQWRQQCQRMHTCHSVCKCRVFSEWSHWAAGAGQQLSANIRLVSHSSKTTGENKCAVQTSPEQKVIITMNECRKGLWLLHINVLVICFSFFQICRKNFERCRYKRATMSILSVNTANFSLYNVKLPDIQGILLTRKLQAGSFVPAVHTTKRQSDREGALRPDPGSVWLWVAVFSSYTTVHNCSSFQRTEECICCPVETTGHILTDTVIIFFLLLNSGWSSTTCCLEKPLFFFARVACGRFVLMA